MPTEEVQLEVLLCSGQKVKVNLLTSDQTEVVLEVRRLKALFLAAFSKAGYSRGLEARCVVPFSS